MHLEMEELDDLFRMFKGKEVDTPIFIGQMNYRSETTMSVDIVVSTRFVEEGNVTIITKKTSVGLAELPNQLYDKPETKEIYEAQVKALGNLDVLYDAQQEQMEKLFKEKGFTTYRGIWTDGSQI